ncbi:MAG: hypothetical protein QM757_39585 [Paludibaculum sp.]
MPTPPLHFPNHIQFLNIAPGTFASSAGGGLIKAPGNAIVQIQSDPAGVFSVESLEVLALERDPDVPHAPPAWQTVNTANGPGPISVEPGEALIIRIGFTCPVHPALDSYTATAVAASSSAPQTPLLQLAISGTVSPGTVSIASLAPLSIAPGQTVPFPFRLSSSLRHDAGGVFTCDSRTPSPFTSDTSPQFPTLPAGGTLDVALPVTCAAGTAAGIYPVVFQFRAIDNSAQFGSLTTNVSVMTGRAITVTSNLAPNLTLDHGSSTLCELHAVVSGGPGTFSIAPSSVPKGISLSNAQQSAAVNGNVFLGFTINVDSSAPVGPLSPPLTIHYSVAANELHPEVSGDISFNIQTPKRSLLFGFSSFHVENCRSKGDHNDSDTLIVVVSTNKDAFPAQQILLGDNLHAGDPVNDKFVGPFEIDDTDTVTATFTVLNGATGDKSAEVGAKIVGVVLGAVAGLEEAHFLGLVATDIEKGILGAASGIFGGLGELLGIHPSNPDCSGAILVRTFTFSPGQLTDMPWSSNPVLETQKSPSECGNDPHTTVTYSIRQVS